MKMCSVFLRRGVVYVHANSQTSGPWIAGPPFITFDWSTHDIGRRILDAVSAALEGSLEGLACPTQWDQSLPLFRLANVKSWREFTRGDCKLVHIQSDGGRIIVVPQRKSEANGAFAPEGQPTEYPLDEITDWKAVLADAFERCT